MNAADIYRYSERGKVDQNIRAMQERIVEELRADRGAGRLGLFGQDPSGAHAVRMRKGRMQAWQEAWDVTAQHYRDEYMRIEREVQARWGIDA